MNPTDAPQWALVAGETGAEFSGENVNSDENSPVGASFLIFRLGATLFALPALAVREIHALPFLLPLPETAPFVLGMFNLRGAIVPVIDLNARLGHDSSPLSLDDTVIVLSFGDAPVAIVAHEVRSVSRLSSAQIEPPPAHGRQSDLAAPFVVGVAQIDEEIVLILHLPRLLDFSLQGSEGDGFSTSFSPLPARFDEKQWSGVQREVLHERAARLRAAAPGGVQSEDIQREQGFDSDASQTGKRAPVAIFTLGGEEFATPLDLVREFASVSSVASVPCCPPHILGQINLRGDIVTLLDVRQTLRTARTQPDFFAAKSDGSAPKPVSVVVVQHEGAGVGIAVDEVRDVLYLRPDEWSALDARGAAPLGEGESYFAGGAIYQGRLLPLLDIGRLLAHGGLEVEELA